MQIQHRKANISDLDLYFEWTNNPITRSNSFNTQEVDYQEHTNWFSGKVEDKKALLLVFENKENIPVGQIRIEQKTDENIIGISIDKNFRGLGLAVPMLTSACEVFFIEFQAIPVETIIMYNNTTIIPLYLEFLISMILQTNKVSAR